MKTYFKTLSLAALIILLLSSCIKERFQREDYSDFSGTIWVITRYDNTLTNQSFFPQDTIHFLDHNSYKINEGPVRDYTYYAMIDTESRNEFYQPSPRLLLDDCSTFGGDYNGIVQRSNINENSINNILFERGDDHSLIVWLEKVN